MSLALKRLIRDRKVIVSTTSRDMVLKELSGAASDLKDAIESLDAINHKWATVQAYYSAFHSARALLYAKGLREKGHRGLLAAIGELYAREIPMSLFTAFSDAMSMREAADYGLTFSKEGAFAAIETAKEFLHTARKIIRPGRESSLRQENIIPFLEKSEAKPRARKK